MDIIVVDYLKKSITRLTSYQKIILNFL